MNNLKSLKVRSHPVDDLKGQIIYVSVAEENQGKEVYYLKEHTLVCADITQSKEFVLSKDIINVISAEYMSTQNKITVATNSSIIVIDCETKNIYKREFDTEVRQVGWNNTYDFLAIIFKNGIVNTFLLDMRFQLICKGEGNVYASVPQREDVGWGSIKTQFQGPKGSKQNDRSQSLGEAHTVPTDDEKPVISWRGNGEEFVVSYFQEGVRQFKVFDHSCQAKANSEMKNGVLYGPIAWKPLGNLIAAAIYQDNRNCIGLFEKNGLFRMQFSLVDIYYPITFLSWSSCSRVLNVTQEDDKGQMHVCLYTTSNTRWYLKQHLVFQLSNPLCTLTWTTTSPQCIELIAVTKNEVIQYKYKFEFDIDYRNNLVAAIDGRSICIHGFKDTVDPPPSSTSIVELKNPINMLAFHPYKDLAVAIDSANNIYTFSVSGVELSIIHQSFLTEQVFPLNVNHLFWKGDNPHVLIDKPSEFYSTLYEFDNSTCQLVKRHQFDVTTFAVEHICAVGNTLITYDAKSRTVSPPGETMWNVLFPLKVIPMKYENEIYCITLTPEQELYVENEFVCRGVTSVILHKDYLLVTDNITLYTIKLHQHSLDTLSVEGLSEFHTRPLNETSHLICMMGDSSNVVLCTPRGNLEIISCRPMEVRIVEDLLDKGEWREAIKFMRLTRMNWNLLIDLNPDRFYENLPKIIDECNSQNILNSVVAEVNDENCLTTVYNKTSNVVPLPILNKKRNFLGKLCKLLDESGTFSDYLPTVLKICVDRNDLKKAMAYTSFLLNSENAELREKAEKAINLLRIHVEAEDLFKAALHMFDMKLADFVAQKCQMNPQEVDPILNELRMLNDVEKRLAIHLRYRNWEEAIAYLIRKQSICKNEVLSFIEEHDVAKRAYSEALKLKLTFKEDIAKLYIDKLISEGRHSEAAVISVKYGFFDLAVNQFKLALECQKCIEYLPFSSYTENDKKSLFSDLAEKLIVIQKVRKAANIYEYQLEDPQKAIKTLTQARLFTDALRVARKHSFLNLIDVYILPQMMDSVQIIIDHVNETSKQFKKYLERLKKLRNSKKFNLLMQLKKLTIEKHTNGENSIIASSDSFGSRLKVLERERGGEFNRNLTVFDAEVQSVVSAGSRRSSRSNSSALTTSTMKQVRKMEREKQDTTEGSRLEDIALMREMHIMITSVFKLGPEIREIFLGLIEYSKIDINALKNQQAKVLDLQKLMKDEASNVWDENFKNGSNTPHISANFDFIDPLFRTPPSEIENPGDSWVLDILTN